MGLCKCPKKKVTNQFCFEHRVNVCEHCMVTNHPKCVVQSYLQWLKDCDYNPICELCSGALVDTDCIRLTCYHTYNADYMIFGLKEFLFLDVFHWVCVAEYGRSLPLTTGPAGYSCPTCKVCLFPASNFVSPVADALREKLASVNWARAGLGLPLLIEKETPVSPPPHFQNDVVPRSHAVVHVDPSPQFQIPRRVVEDFEDVRQTPFDHDENKYKRRSPLEFFTRRWKALWRPVPRGRNFFRRYLARLFLVVIVLGVCVVILSWLGGIVTRDDPSLEIHNNPNIRVGGFQEA